MKSISIIMPTYNQASFISRAINSVQRQSYQHWELLIINDGCTDNTEDVIKTLISRNPKISYIKLNSNRGLGHAINRGLERAKHDIIAYLPSDDFFMDNHLEVLAKTFSENKDAALVFSGMITGDNDSITRSPGSVTNGTRNGYCLQLVQTAHVKTTQRWIERDDYVTNDLFNTFWYKLTHTGSFYPTNKITCCWTDHPHQRHKVISENYNGGLNNYRQFYNIQEPVKTWVSDYKFIDEQKMYASFRGKYRKSKKSLKILLVGALSYNPERIHALEQAGHRLFGLWARGPLYSYETVGPLPFGQIKDIPWNNWQKAISILQPDIIYSLLNTVAIPLARKVMETFPRIPFIWHFKEGPSVALRKGLWNELIELYSRADGRIFISPQAKKYYELFTRGDDRSSLILDGDLPKKEYFTDDFSRPLSELDNDVHTVVAGRMVGISLDNVRILAQNNIHLHLYTENFHFNMAENVEYLVKAAPSHFHVHKHCKPASWVKEFSRYDAGWLHCFKSENNGQPNKYSWDDLNIPARLNTMAAAGLPVIQSNNDQHDVAMQAIVKDINAGIFFNDMHDLASQLKNKQLTNQLRYNMVSSRKQFCFDHHVPRLIDFFWHVIKNKSQGTPFHLLNTT